MNIETKMNVGDNIYFITKISKAEETPCPVCCGKGEVTLPNYEHSFSCPNCYGDGLISKYRKSYWAIMEIDNTPYKGKIRQIDITCDEKGILHIMYIIGRFCNVCNEEDCFYTKTLAQEECDRRNQNVETED